MGCKNRPSGALIAVARCYTVLENTSKEGSRVCSSDISLFLLSECWAQGGAKEEGREGKGREGKGREGKGREGKET